jgi:hypothetical protein
MRLTVKWRGLNKHIYSDEAKRGGNKLPLF